MASCQQKEDKNMTSMTKKFLTIMCTAMVAILAFTACSNDDEPKAVSSEEILLNINKVIVEQANAEKLYQRGEDGSTLVMIADSKEAAHKLCERLILDRWDGKQRTIKFSDNKGVITLAPGTDESVFYNVTLKALDNFGDLLFASLPKHIWRERIFLGNDSLYQGGYVPIADWRHLSSTDQRNAIDAEVRILNNK